jgi:hypothetical protein
LSREKPLAQTVQLDVLVQLLQLALQSPQP